MNNKTWTPLIIACASAFFIWFGMKIQTMLQPESSYKPYSSSSNIEDGGLSSRDASSKLVYLFDLLRDRYVDTLNLKELVDDAIPTIIQELDPHSAYFTQAELQEVNEQLDGSFSGIGVQFNIQNDTVMVIQVVSGGPAEKIGLMAGDRIVEVNDSVFCGPESGINNTKVQKTLKGPKGTSVKIGVRRATSDKVLYFEVIRGDIPVNSVTAQYLIEGNVGYILVDNFGRNTYNEFFTALIHLKSRGAKGYIIDLRNNSGGFMEVCCQTVNEFLGKSDLIVYTEGKGVGSNRSEVRADGNGNFQDEPVVVLINEWSASASEILAGAIQDNDRGTIIGRRSFGKGLVQQQFDLNDGSALRITTARYHTPSGRCIQKPYDLGKGDDYMMDIINRYDRGEFYSQDSIHLADSLKFYTKGGRVVYEGGGIMPDIFIPQDTTFMTPYYNRCVNLGLCYAYSFKYNDENREKLTKFANFEEMEAYLKAQNLMDKFVSYASDKAKPSANDLKLSRQYLEKLIIAYVMRHSKDDNYFYREYNSHDETYLKAIEVLKEQINLQ
mgnify:FL=1